MILYSLQCGREHGFEAWFRDGATYDAQVAAGEVSCPTCADTAISKAPMAPRIAKGVAAPTRGAGTESGVQAGSGAEAEADAPRPDARPAAGKAVMDPRLREMARLRAAMLSLKKMVTDNCDHVGADFAKEARRIHHGEAEERAIYGEATDDEAQELADEGVPFGRIPWPSENDA